MSIFKDTNKTKDGRQYYFRVQTNNRQYKSKRYLTRKEALKAEAMYKLKSVDPVSKKFTVVADSYFEYLKTYCKYIY